MNLDIFNPDATGWTSKNQQDPIELWTFSSTSMDGCVQLHFSPQNQGWHRKIYRCPGPKRECFLGRVVELAAREPRESIFPTKTGAKEGVSQPYDRCGRRLWRNAINGSRLGNFPYSRYFRRFLLTKSSWHVFRSWGPPYQYKQLLTLSHGTSCSRACWDGGWQS